MPSNTLRCIVAGGRDFINFNLMVVNLDEILYTYENVCIVSGKAKGADQLGERYASLKGYFVAEFPAPWNDLTIPGAIIRTRPDGSKYNIAAGPIRNNWMAEWAKAGPYGGFCVVFWNGKSKGSRNMINTANTHGIPLRVINY